MRHNGIWMILPCILALDCGSDPISRNPGSETHWLTRCDASSECGDGSCVCGRCTVLCEAAADCAGLHAPRETACVEPTGWDACRTASGSPASSCWPTCEVDSDCTGLDADLECTGGLCVPRAIASTPRDAAADVDAGEQPEGGGSPNDVTGGATSSAGGTAGSPEGGGSAVPTSPQPPAGAGGLSGTGATNGGAGGTPAAPASGGAAGTPGAPASGGAAGTPAVPASGGAAGAPPDGAGGTSEAQCPPLSACTAVDDNDWHGPCVHNCAAPANGPNGICIDPSLGSCGCGAALQDECAAGARCLCPSCGDGPGFCVDDALEQGLCSSPAGAGFHCP
jgi:hypothetical protein